MVGGGAGIVDRQGAFLLFGHWLLYLIAALGSTALGMRIVTALPRVIRNGRAKAVVFAVIYMGIFVISVSFLVTDTFNPFLYFRF